MTLELIVMVMMSLMVAVVMSLLVAVASLLVAVVMSLLVAGLLAIFVGVKLSLMVAVAVAMTYRSSRRRGEVRGATWCLPWCMSEWWWHLAVLATTRALLRAKPRHVSRRRAPTLRTSRGGDDDSTGRDLMRWRLGHRTV